MITTLISLTVLAAVTSYLVWLDVKEKRFTDLETTISVLNKYSELVLLQRELALISVGRSLLGIEGDNVEDRRFKDRKGCVRGL